MMKILSNRIREVLNVTGWTQAELARRSGVTRAAPGEWLNGKVKNLSATAARKLSVATGFSAVWLATGEGEMMLKSESPSEIDYTLVPILDVHASCGDGYFNDQALLEGGFALPKTLLRELGVPDGQGRIIHAKGQSMSTTINDGSVVLINLADREPRERGVYAINMPYDGLVLKRLIHEYNQQAGEYVWIMRSDNPDKIQHPDKVLPPAVIVGRAVWYANKL